MTWKPVQRCCWAPPITCSPIDSCQVKQLTKYYKVVHPKGLGVSVSEKFRHFTIIFFAKINDQDHQQRHQHPCNKSQVTNQTKVTMTMITIITITTSPSLSTQDPCRTIWYPQPPPEDDIAHMIWWRWYYTDDMMTGVLIHQVPNHLSASPPLSPLLLFPFHQSWKCLQQRTINPT